MTKTAEKPSSLRRHIPVWPIQRSTPPPQLSRDENEHVGGTHFHMNGLARRFVLTERQIN